MRLIDLDSDIKGLTEVLCHTCLCLASAETVALKVGGDVRRCLDQSVLRRIVEHTSTDLADSLDIPTQALNVVVKIVDVDS